MHPSPSLCTHSSRCDFSERPGRRRCIGEVSTDVNQQKICEPNMNRLRSEDELHHLISACWVALHSRSVELLGVQQLVVGELLGFES